LRLAHFQYQQKRAEFFDARPASSELGNPKGGDVGVAFSLVTFLLAKQKKVTPHQAKNMANRKPPNPSLSFPKQQQHSLNIPT
jgi:hypothetical protein